MKTNDLVSWVGGRGADNPCPFCRTNDWIGEVKPETDDLAEVNLISIKGQTELGWDSAIHSAFMLTCGNCGFIRLHNVKIVTKND